MRNGRRNVAEANARFATPENIPIGWRAGSLGEVAGLQSGYAFKSTWFATEGIRLLRGTNIEPGGIRWNDVVYMPTHRIGDFERYQLNAGDVVIAMDRPIISAGLKVAVLRENDVPSLLLQRVGRFQCSDVLDSSFLYQYLNSEHFIRHIERQATGTQLPHISGTDIETAPLPLPPLNEQRRIVAKLDALQERSRRARASLDAVPALLDKLRQSILAAAFRGDLTRDFREQHKDLEPASLSDGLPSSPARKDKKRLWGSGRTADGIDEAWGEIPATWQWVRVANLSAVPGGAVQIGPMSMKSSEFTDEGNIVLNVGCVQRGRIDTAKADHLPTQRACDFERYRLKTGDVLFTRSGTVGRCACLPIELDGALMTFHLLRVRPSPERCSPSYLMYAFQGCGAVTAQINISSVGATRAGFNTRLLEEMWIPLPPLDEQIALVNRVNEIFSRVDSLADDCGFLQSEADTLDRAILAKAFRGELVPQDPRDEPADELLARVRADQAAPSTPRGRKRAAEAALHD